MIMRPVLFISHSAGRTGAPLMLLNALRWIKENTDLNFEILLNEGGVLYQDFAEIAPTRILGEEPRRGTFNRLKRLIKRESRSPTASLSALVELYTENEIGLIYANTVTLGHVLDGLEGIPCPVITHIHEMSHWIDQCGEKNLELVKSRSSLIVAASAAVKNNLVTNYSFSESRIKVIDSFLPIPETGPEPQAIDRVAGLLGIEPGDTVVISSGHETMRKGKDLFVELGAQLYELNPSRQWKLVWVGGWEKPEHEQQLLGRIRELGLDGKIHFTGDVSNPLDYFSLAQVFVVLSREEPLGLVALEATLLGKPVICFANAGGISDFVAEDHGIAVPYLDTRKAAGAVDGLVADPAKARYLNQRAIKKVVNCHNLATGARAMYQTVCSQLADKVLLDSC